MFHHYPRLWGGFGLSGIRSFGFGGVLRLVVLGNVIPPLNVGVHSNSLLREVAPGGDCRSSFVQLSQSGARADTVTGETVREQGLGFFERGGGRGGRVNNSIIIFICNKNRMHINRKSIQIFSDLSLNCRLDGSCRRIRVCPLKRWFVRVGEVVIPEQGVHLL